MENQSTINEIKTIINFLNIIYETPTHNLSMGISINATDFYSTIFAYPEKLNSITLVKLKLDYINLIERAVRNLNNSGRNYSKALDTLYSIQAYISEFSTDDTINKLDKIKAASGGYKERLELFEEIYAEKFEEKLIDNKKIQELDNQLQNLINELKTTDIDDNFKFILMENLLNIQYCIQKYNILGIQGVRNEINRLTGTMFMNIGDPENSTPTEKNIFKRILEFIKSGNEIVKLGENICKIGQLASPAIITLVDNLVK